MTKIKFRCRGDGPAYVAFIAGMVEHWSKIDAVASIYNEHDLYTREQFEIFLEDVTEFLHDPIDDWGFTITFRDQEFAVWFKLKYS